MKTNKVKTLYHTRQINEKYISICSHAGHFNASNVNQSTIQKIKQ
jgi:hypothetical protein